MILFKTDGLASGSGGCRVGTAPVDRPPRVWGAIRLPNQFGLRVNLLLAITLWLGSTGFAACHGQEMAAPADLMERRARLNGSGAPPAERRLECAALVAEANRRLPANHSVRLRMALDCADTDATAGHLPLALEKLDALLLEIRSISAHPAMEVIAIKFRANALTGLGRNPEAMRELERALEMANQRFGVGSDHSQDVGMRLCGAYKNNARGDDAVKLCGAIARQRASAAAGDYLRAYANLYGGGALVRRDDEKDIRRGLELLASSVIDFSTKYGQKNLNTLEARREHAYGLLRNKQGEEAERTLLVVRDDYATLYGENFKGTIDTDMLLRIIYLGQGKNDAAHKLQDRLDRDAPGENPVGRLRRDLAKGINLLTLQRDDEALATLTAWAAGVERVREQLGLDAVGKAQVAQEWHQGYLMLAVANKRKSRLRAALVSLELSKARSLQESMGDMDRLRSLPEQERAVALTHLREASFQRQRLQLAAPATPVALESSRLAIESEKRLADSLKRGETARDAIGADAVQVDKTISALIPQMTEDEAYLSFGYSPSQADALMPILLWRGRVYMSPRPFVIIPNIERTVYAMRMLAQHGRSGLRKLGFKVVARPPGGFDVVPEKSDEGEIADPRLVVEYLSQKILDPFKKELEGVRKLVISGDGPAWLIPFDLLELAGQPLFRSVTISYAPSAAVLGLQKNRLQASLPDRTAARLLAVGGARYQRVVQLAPGSPVFISRVKAPQVLSAYEAAALADAGSGTQFLGQFISMVGGSRDLPGSLLEVERVSRRFSPANVTVLTEEEATEKRIDRWASANQLAGFDYLHFATHGIAQIKRPLMSALIMGLDDRDSQHDGYLSAQEISAWNLKARMVVLSACDSAVGKSISGEGILGLPYAFLVAGAATTIQTSWAIPDMETAQWMDQLYERVLTGEIPSHALARIKQQMALAQKWQPAYERGTDWAAFALYGW